MHVRSRFLLLLMLASGLASTARADVYVLNGNGNSVTVYGDDADGNVVPIRTIAGPATRLQEPSTLTVDPINEELWVAQFYGAEIDIFALADSGNVAPLRWIIDEDASYGSQPRTVAVDAPNDVIFVNWSSAIVTAFSRLAEGEAVALRTLAGPSTRINNSFAMVYDSIHHELFVDSYDVFGGDAGVLVFDAAAAGDAAPVRVIASQPEIGSYVNYLAYDQDAGELYVQGGGGAAVLVFDRAADETSTPKRILVGPSTELEEIQGLAVDPIRRRLWVGVFTMDERLLSFDADADGDVAPVATVVGDQTGLNGIFDVGVWPRDDSDTGTETDTATTTDGGTDGTTSDSTGSDASDTGGGSGNGASSEDGSSSSTDGGTDDQGSESGGDDGGDGGCGCATRPSRGMLGALAVLVPLWLPRRRRRWS